MINKESEKDPSTGSLDVASAWTINILRSLVFAVGEVRNVIDVSVRAYRRPSDRSVS